MIAIVDYGMSNLRSVLHAFMHLEAEARIISKPGALDEARGIVLPGDGAFGEAMENLRRGGWVSPLCAAINRGVPFLGICLGMQLLFETSEEMGAHRGLGVLPGCVKRFQGGKIPQIGWNQIRKRGDSRMLSDTPDTAWVYLLHSYYCEPGQNDIVAATTEYGMTYASAIEEKNIWGAQFHPEKSGKTGLALLANFVAYCESQDG
jgi:glutamine amidotransferase